MLILLPPSEGKNQPISKAQVNLAKLAFPKELLEIRSRLLTKALATSPAAKAMDVYTGVLYQALDWKSLTPAAKAKGNLPWYLDLIIS